MLCLDRENPNRVLYNSFSVIIVLAAFAVVAAIFAMWSPDTKRNLFVFGFLAAAVLFFMTIWKDLPLGVPVPRHWGLIVCMIVCVVHALLCGLEEEGNPRPRSTYMSWKIMVLLIVMVTSASVSVVLN